MAISGFACRERRAWSGLLQSPAEWGFRDYGWDIPMTNKERKRRGMKTVARAAVLTALSAATIGGAIVPNVASAAGRGPDGWAELTPFNNVPARMHITTNAPGGYAVPGEKATVAVEWDLWNIWSQFQTDKANGNVDGLQDVVKIFASQTPSLTLDGVKCEEYGDRDGKTAMGKAEGGTNYEPVDLGGLVAQIRNLLSKAAALPTGGNDNAISKFFQSRVRATCEFTVKKKQATDINVGGNVALSNMFIFNTTQTGVAVLPVKQPDSPNAPQWSTSAASVEVNEGGELTGKADPGTTIRLEVDGAPRENPNVKADANGYFKIKLPDDLKAGSGHQIVATSESDNGGKPAKSRSLFVNIKSADEPKPVVDKPVITSPTGDVKAGDELTVTGTDGNQVSAVDQNGKVLAGPVTIANGQVKIKLPSDLGGATQIKVVAKPKDGSGEGKASDPKNVVAEKPELFQSDPSTVQLGKEGVVNVSFVPRDGDFTKIAGKKLVLTAPDGVAFIKKASYQTFDAAHNPLKGKGEWLGEIAEVGDGGKTLTVPLPAAKDLENSKTVEFKVTAVATTAEGATPGEKTNGTATVDGYTAPLKVTVAQ
ncbi:MULTISPECIES: Ig-like domain-containing protein [Amycolatopsis]|nr:MULTISPECIES: Ig-like domain-containing protein [Amycolatopsis]